MTENDDLILEIKKRLATLNPSSFSLRDDSIHHDGHHDSQGAGHFNLTIACEHFKDKDVLSCHRLIYNALGDLFPAKIHALKIRIQRN